MTSNLDHQKTGREEALKKLIKIKNEEQKRNIDNRPNHMTRSISWKPNKRAIEVVLACCDRNLKQNFSMMLLR